MFQIFLRIFKIENEGNSDLKVRPELPKHSKIMKNHEKASQTRSVSLSGVTLKMVEFNQPGVLGRAQTLDFAESHLRGCRFGFRCTRTIKFGRDYQIVLITDMLERIFDSLIFSYRQPPLFTIIMVIMVRILIWLKLSTLVGTHS